MTRRLTLKEISVRLEIPKTTVIRIIHEHLHMKIVSARRVPRLISSFQKEHRLTCCQRILELCRGNQKQVLESAVTGMKPWSFIMILYQKGNQWNGANQAKHRRERPRYSVRQEDQAAIFWDWRGILLIDFKESNTTVNAAYYASLLHKLRDAINP